MSWSKGQWIKEYENRGALWIHNGDPARPHVRLTSGLHTNGYFNSRIIISDTGLMRQIALELVRLFFSRGMYRITPIHVVGPTSVRGIVEAVSDELKAYSIPSEWSLVAKSREEGSRRMDWENPESIISSMETALIVDDIFTTGLSTALIAEAILSRGGKLSSVVLVLINRSSNKIFDERRILSLAEQYIPTWRPEECPLCEKGSRVIYPAKDHWDELIGH
jgi:orotate phosphoribosyltransferase